MSILMGHLPHRRHSRRRTRTLRARLLFAVAVLTVCVGIAWQPFSPPRSASARVDPSGLAAIVAQAEPEQSVDTEGALGNPDPRTDAVRYVADR